MNCSFFFTLMHSCTRFPIKILPVTGKISVGFQAAPRSSSTVSRFSYLDASTLLLNIIDQECDLCLIHIQYRSLRLETFDVVRGVQIGGVNQPSQPIFPSSDYLEGDLLPFCYSCTCFSSVK